MKIVLEIIKMPFLNRLKQFMLKLLHIKEFFSVESENPSLLDIVVSREDVLKAIGELKPSYGAGPDLLPAILLKK